MKSVNLKIIEKNIKKKFKRMTAGFRLLVEHATIHNGAESSQNRQFSLFRRDHECMEIVGNQTILSHK